MGAIDPLKSPGRANERFPFFLPLQPLSLSPVHSARTRLFTPLALFCVRFIAVRIVPTVYIGKGKRRRSAGGRGEIFGCVRIPGKERWLLLCFIVAISCIDFSILMLIGGKGFCTGPSARPSRVNRLRVTAE